MFANVLVGYEGSDRSEDALALALVLKDLQATVTAACSYWWEPLSARPGRSGPGEPMLRAQADATLAPLRYRGGAVIETVAAPGATPADALRELTRQRKPELVVVGSTHRGALGRVLAGSTADTLLRGGRCPVAVAPLGYRERSGAGLRRIGVAFDDSEPSHVALDVAHAFAAERGAELVILRAFSRVPVLAAGDLGYGTIIDEPDLRHETQLLLDSAVEGLRARSAVAVSGELLDGDPALAIAERSSGLDLLVVGSTGHGVFGRVLLGSVSHHLMCNSATPVLAVPPE